MKKLFAILLVLTMILSFAACADSDKSDDTTANDKSNTENSNDDDGGEKVTPVEEIFGLDLASSEEQPMSSERGERDAIYAAVKAYFGDALIFSGTDFAKMTYHDLKELIGVDASYYYYNAETSEQTFVWLTSDHETAKLTFSFRFDELYGMGSSNMKG